MKLNHISKIIIAIIILFLSIVTFFLIKTDFSICGEIKTDKLAHFGAFTSGILGITLSGITLIILLRNKRFSEETAEIALLNNIYDNLNKDINDATLGEFKGTEAYRNYSIANMKNNPPNNLLDNINLVNSSFEMYFDYIDKKVFLNKKIELLNKNRLYLLYYSKVLWPLFFKLHVEGTDLIKIHDDSKNIVLKYSKLSKRCISYLDTQGLIVLSDFKDSIIKEIDILIADIEKTNKK